MKKLIYLSIIVSGVIILSSATENKSAGPPGCFAGEPPNFTNCTSCHSDFPVNFGTATILFDLGGADTGYIPGATYDIKVSIQKPGLPAGGFLFTALQDNDITTTPGIITLNDAVRTQTIDLANPHVQGCGLQNKVYVEHTYQGHTSPTPGENSWDFKWKAPPTYVGDITFYLATVESNYSGDEFGDYVYTRKVQSKDRTTGIDQVSGAFASLSVYPNPAMNKTFIKRGNLQIDKIELVNMQGMKLKEFNDLPANKAELVLDLQDISAGVYFVIIKGEGISVARKLMIL